MSNEATKKYESEVIKGKLGKLRGTAVAIPGDQGGYAYVREPSEIEFMTIQAQSDAPHDAYVPAFSNYVKECFIGACDDAGNELSFSDVKRIAGPGFVSTGPLGKAVNKLGGNREAATRDLSF